MSLQNKLEAVGTALAAVVPQTYHYWHPPKINPPFCVWQEDGENGFEADDLKVDQAVSGTVDYFTRTEYDPACDSIQTALNGIEASWYLNSVQFEDETNLIHYEWVFEVV